MVDSQHNEDPNIQSFFKWEQSESTGCSGTGGAKNDEERRYLRRSSLEAYLQGGMQTDRLLRALYPQGNPPPADYVRSHYLRPFAILLSINRGLFIRNFVDCEDLQDHKLPFRSKPLNFPRSGTNDDLWEEFRSRQWAYCPVMLSYNMGSQLDPLEILPFRAEQQEIGHGGTSFVHKITVDSQYNELSLSLAGDRNGNAHQSDIFVIKTYRGREARAYYETEREAYTRLQSGGRPPENIVRFYGGFVRGDTYNLILEYADQGSLEDFLQKNYPPCSGNQILLFWNRLFGIFAGLSRIHFIQPVQIGSRTILGFHQDIKPANILVRSRNDPQSIYNCDFLIADLGLSHFKMLGGRSQDESDKDTFGTYAYGAPETFRPAAMETLDLLVRRQVDLWSLACVFSEVATWIFGGWPRLDEYRRRRQEEAKRTLGKDHGELFHDGQKVLKTVEDSHKIVIRSCRADDLVTGSVLRGPVATMLKEKPEDRLEVQRVHGQAEEIIRHAQESPSNIEHTEIEGTLPDVVDPSVMGFVNTRLNSSPHVPPPQTDSRRPAEHTKAPGPEVMLESSSAQRKERPFALSLADAKAIKTQKPRFVKAYFPGQKCLENLMNTKQVFLIDSTTTMATHKADVKDVLDVLGDLVKRVDPSGVDMFFTTSDHSEMQCKKTPRLLKTLDATPFDGKSNMALKLDELLRRYVINPDGHRNERRGLLKRSSSANFCRRLSILVLTDGIWQPGCDVIPHITSMVNRMEQHGLHEHHAGIQFIRFGQNQDARRLLKRLDNGLGLEFDIVNTTSASGSVYKMLLGSTESWYGADDDDDDPT